jgi:hypothetical protein
MDKFGDWFWRQRPWLRVVLAMPVIVLGELAQVVAIGGFILVVLNWAFWGGSWYGTWR